jgi:hypothetical protein
VTAEQYPLARSQAGVENDELSPVPCQSQRVQKRDRTRKEAVIRDGVVRDFRLARGLGFRGDLCHAGSSDRRESTSGDQRGGEDRDFRNRISGERPQERSHDEHAARARRLNRVQAPQHESTEICTNLPHYYY